MPETNPSIYLSISVVMCFVAAMSPLLLVLNVDMKVENEAGSVIVLFVFGMLGAITVFKAFKDFRIELRFYGSNSLDSDSQVSTQMKTIVGMSGKTRLFLYYPFVFLVGSTALAVFVGSLIV